MPTLVGGYVPKFSNWVFGFSYQVVHTLSIEVISFSVICFFAALGWGGAACVLSHAVEFSVPSPLLGQTLYKSFD